MITFGSKNYKCFYTFSLQSFHKKSKQKHEKDTHSSPVLQHVVGAIRNRACQSLSSANQHRPSKSHFLSLLPYLAEKGRPPLIRKENGGKGSQTVVVDRRILTVFSQVSEHILSQRLVMSYLRYT